MFAPDGSKRTGLTWRPAVAAADWIDVNFRGILAQGVLQYRAREAAIPRFLVCHPLIKQFAHEPRKPRLTDAEGASQFIMLS